MEYSIIWVRGHVEVYDWAGRFCFSADNEREAREELAASAAQSDKARSLRSGLLTCAA